MKLHKIASVSVRNKMCHIEPYYQNCTMVLIREIDENRVMGVVSATSPVSSHGYGNALTGQHANVADENSLTGYWKRTYCREIFSTIQQKVSIHH